MGDIHVDFFRNERHNIYINHLSGHFFSEDSTEERWKDMVMDGGRDWERDDVYAYQSDCFHEIERLRWYTCGYYSVPFGEFILCFLFL